MKRFNELTDNDAEALLRYAARREDVVYVERTANTATFSVPHPECAHVSFDVSIDSVQDFIQKFPVACFNAKCMLTSSPNSDTI